MTKSDKGGGGSEIADLLVMSFLNGSLREAFEKKSKRNLEANKNQKYLFEKVKKVLKAFTTKKKNPEMQKMISKLLGKLRKK